MNTERKVDVLAVMHDLVDSYEAAAIYQGEGNYGLDESLMADAKEALAAVDELAAALREYDRWNYEVQSAKQTGESVYSYAELTAMREKAVAMGQAALARIGGAQ